MAGRLRIGESRTRRRAALQGSIALRSAMRRVQLIHWNAAEAQERAAMLRTAGYEVAWGAATPRSLGELREDPPSAVVIDLSRLPMQGRDAALAIRHYQTTRRVPLVFVDGDPDKVSRIRQQLPDAIYTTWGRIRSSLKRAVTRPPAVTVVPRSLLEGYSGTPLVRKLGIKANTIVALVRAPRGFKTTLGDLPEGVRLGRKMSSQSDLTLWFTRSRKDLESGIDSMASLAEKGGLWIAWPKKTSRMAADLTQSVVREAGLAAGLVDFKVCAIDATWAGLRFSLRKPR